jgi:hypothetical protein
VERKNDEDWTLKYRVSVERVEEGRLGERH